MQFNHCIQQLPRPTLYLKLYFQAQDVVSTQCLGFTMSDGQGRCLLNQAKVYIDYAKNVPNMQNTCKKYAKYLHNMQNMQKCMQNVLKKLQKYAKIYAEYANKYAKNMQKKYARNAKK